MTVWYRTCDTSFPFLWADDTQPAARWHAAGRGPAHYLADTPSGAWAEFLRHEGITDPADLDGVQRALWAVEVPDATVVAGVLAELDDGVQRGGTESYPSCQAEAERIRASGAPALLAPSAALQDGGAAGWLIGPDGEEIRGQSAEGVVLVVFGDAPLVGWAACRPGQPDPRVLPHVRALS